MCCRLRLARCSRCGAAQALQLLFELLIAILQFLDRPGELAHLRLQAVDARDEIGFGHLRVSSTGPQRARHYKYRNGRQGS